MTIIQAVRDWVETCPLLEGGQVHVDFLDPEASSYSVDVTPGEPVVKQYLDGSSRRQFLFRVASRALYGDDIRQNLDNIGFFEQFADWVEEQNLFRRLPNLGEGKRSMSLEVTTSGYVFEENTTFACYQIQCRLTYLQEGIL